MEYITESADRAKEKIGTSKLYCTYTNTMFDSIHELYKSCDRCSWACDRIYYKCAKKHNLNGLHMKPLFKDPVIVINFSELPNNLKIKREI